MDKKSELIFDIINMIKLKNGSVDSEKKKYIIDKVLNADEHELKIIEAWVENMKKVDEKIIRKINQINERRFKAIESNMRKASDYGLHYVVDPFLSTDDQLLKKLEEMFM